MSDPTSRTTAVYEAHATSYAALNAALTPIQHLLEQFQDHLPAGRLLDLGCGPGRDAAYFTGQSYTVVGLDCSLAQLKLAHLQTAAADFLLGDMRTLPFAPAQFDGVWANASLLHLPREDGPGVLAEVRRVIKPGGWLMVSVKRGTGAAWVKAPDYGGEQRYFTYYQPDEIAALLEAAGFDPLPPFKEEVWLNAFATARVVPAEHA